MDLKSVAYNFPPTVFVTRNRTGQQLDHLLDEAEEVRMAALSEGLERVVEEVVDLLNSCETYLRIVSELKGAAYVERTFNLVEQKNRARGYYGPL